MQVRPPYVPDHFSICLRMSTDAIDSLSHPIQKLIAQA